MLGASLYFSWRQCPSIACVLDPTFFPSSDVLFELSTVLRSAYFPPLVSIDFTNAWRMSGKYFSFADTERRLSSSLTDGSTMFSIASSLSGSTYDSSFFFIYSYGFTLLVSDFFSTFFGMVRRVPRMVTAPTVAPTGAPMDVDFFTLSLGGTLFVLFGFGSVYVFRLVLYGV